MEKIILDKFGIELSNEEKEWDERNLIGAYTALTIIDNALSGDLKTFVDGATFIWGEYVPTADCPLCTYGGWTTNDKTITFYTIGSSAIPQVNFFHEFGHLIDSLPEPLYDVFSDNLNDETNTTYILGGYINPLALLSQRVADPNYPLGIQAIQASNNGLYEQWADIFANYVAGNINMASTEGQAMYEFVTRTLGQHVTP